MQIVRVSCLLAETVHRECQKTSTNVLLNNIFPPSFHSRKRRTLEVDQDLGNQNVHFQRAMGNVINCLRGNKNYTIIYPNQLDNGQSRLTSVLIQNTTSRLKSTKSPKWHYLNFQISFPPSQKLNRSRSQLKLFSHPIPPVPSYLGWFLIYTTCHCIEL